MNVDKAIEILQAQGYEVKKKKKLQIDGSFLGVEIMTEQRLDSATSKTSTPRVDSLAQARLDAENARCEMMTALDPNWRNRSESYTGKSTVALRDIAKAHKDAYCNRLQGYAT